MPDRPNIFPYLYTCKLSHFYDRLNFFLSSLSLFTHSPHGRSYTYLACLSAVCCHIRLLFQTTALCVLFKPPSITQRCLPLRLQRPLHIYQRSQPLVSPRRLAQACPLRCSLRKTPGLKPGTLFTCKRDSCSKHGLLWVA